MSTETDSSGTKRLRHMIPKRSRGRPSTLVMPPPIPDTSANIARACIQGPPKKDWNYLKPNSHARKPAKA